MSFLFYITLIIAIILLILLQTLIIKKKKMYYKYIDKSKDVSKFDYVQDFDGNWLIKKIEYKSLLIKYSNDGDLKKYVNQIKFISNFTIFLFILLLALMLFYTSL